MVLIKLPPPSKPPKPLLSIMKAGERLIHIYNPDDHGTPVGFRSWGPLHRFDHHRGKGGDPLSRCDDPDRGIYYAAKTLSGCIVEVFGDTGWSAPPRVHVAVPHLLRDISLLDLRGKGAMRIGSVAALSKNSDRSHTQAWSRYIYDSSEVGKIDGILYSNAHNDEDAIALYERASDALECPPNRIMRIMDKRILPKVMSILIEHGIDLL